MRSRRTAPGAEDSSDIIIPVGDAYYSMIGNSVIDYTEFGDEDAGEAEQEVYGIFMEKRASVCEDIMEQLSDSDAASNDSLTDEMQDYMDYVCDTVLTENTGILDSGAVDYSDDTYTEWSQGNISLYVYLNYAISRNWINTVNLSGSSYSSSAEIYQAILDYVEEYIESDSGLTVLLYMAVVLGIPPERVTLLYGVGIYHNGDDDAGGNAGAESVHQRNGRRGAVCQVHLRRTPYHRRRVMDDPAALVQAAGPVQDIPGKY